MKLPKQYYVLVAPANYNVDVLQEGHNWVDCNGFYAWHILLLGKKEARETLEGVKADYWLAHPNNDPPFTIKPLWKVMDKWSSDALLTLTTYKELGIS